jgi:thioredoxin reductase/ferredoxin
MSTAFNPLTWPKRYADWLHLQWPGGSVEKLPVADDKGNTNVDGLVIVGDLTGVPLLKLSANAGHDAVCRIADELDGEQPQDDVLDIAIVGGGTAGFAAAIAAEEKGLRYCVFEANSPFNTIKDFPKGKPIYTYPTETEVRGFTFHDKSDVKEGLVEDLEEQTVDEGLKYVKARVEKIDRRGGLLEVKLAKPAETPDGVHLNGTGFVTDGATVKAKRVVVAIGRSGNYRKLGIPGEDKTDKVTHRLHDPSDYCDKKVLVVGGGDSAMETAISLAECAVGGGGVTVSYRKSEFNRPKPENQEKIDKLREEGKVDILFDSNVTEIRDDSVVIDHDGDEKTVDNDQVFLMIGREAPLYFVRRSGVKIRNERTTWWWISLILFFAFCTWMYHWIKGKPFFGIEGWDLPAALQLDPAVMIAGVRSLAGGYFSDVTTLGGTILESMQGRSFYYTLAYCLCVLIFGIDRYRRRRTPYVFWQTLVLNLIQWVPLFILPEILLPWAGRNGWLDAGLLGWISGHLFPNGEYWRAYGLILAWPLMAWNWFTSAPIYGWLVLGFAQTFVLIPAIIYVWGKGAYCGWICSCGALAETLGDRHREKMPHGKWSNRLNLIGQVLLAFGIVIQLLFILRWTGVAWAKDASDYLALASGLPFFSWEYFVDLIWASLLGVGLYFWFSGRVWCRFACPLAALMHIYHRFGRFAILAEKKKCISCNVCTSVCHQGIDVMSFANKGRPMVDPQCVRCSACVQMCPTGVLEFGTIDRDGNPSGRDPKWLAASPVRLRENSLGGGVEHGEPSQVGPAPVRAKLTINGKRARKSTDPSPVAALIARLT